MRTLGRGRRVRGAMNAALNVYGSGRRREPAKENEGEAEQEDLREQGTLGVEGVCLSETGEVTALKLLRGQGGEVTGTHWVWRIRIPGDLRQRF